MAASENQPPSKRPAVSSSGKKAVWILNSVIVLLLIVTGVLSYRYVSQRELSPNLLASAARQDTTPAKPVRVVQLDVLNGCGAKGIGSKFTNYLRANGYDVVEMKNYKTFHVTETMVVDRVGNLQTARQVAKTLGVSEKNVIQQINPDYYVDVSVIIGKDFSQLKLFP